MAPDPGSAFCPREEPVEPWCTYTPLLEGRIAKDGSRIIEDGPHDEEEWGRRSGLCSDDCP
jgi:hypothetical protein